MLHITASIFGTWCDGLCFPLKDVFKMTTVPETRHDPRSTIARIPLLPKLLIAILSGASLAAVTAQALEMLHH